MFTIPFFPCLVKTIDKLMSKLQQRGAIWLNLVGCQVLIKAILSTFPLYQFTTFLVLASTLCKLAKITRKFLWEGGKKSHKKFRLIKWVVVKSPKSHGGLGIPDPSLMNITLGAKLVWRYTSNHYA